jgi:dCTP deaminase
MILPDHEIEAIGPKVIHPFNPDQVEPASYDVRLGYDFRIFQRDATPFIDLKKPRDITKAVRVEGDEYFLMHPGEFALGTTLERFEFPDNLVGRIEGKSSVGRLGLMVHITAGYIDPGFRGPITLELFCVHPLPVMLYPNQLIAQISFHEMKSAARSPYRGRYQDAQSVESSKYGH